MSLSRGIRYPSPFWGLIPPGLAAFGIFSGSVLSAFAPFCVTARLVWLQGCPFRSLQHAPSGLVKVGRRMRLAFAFSSSLSFPSAVHSLGATKKKNQHHGQRLLILQFSDEVSRRRCFVFVSLCLDTSAKVIQRFESRNRAKSASVNECK